jgi:hypothetical protein
MLGCCTYGIWILSGHIDCFRAIKDGGDTIGMGNLGLGTRLGVLGLAVD